MSHSEIFGMKKDTTGKSLAEFNNSWLFIPTVWEILSEKYLKNRRVLGYDPETKEPLKENIIFNHKLYAKLDDIMTSKETNNEDKILWELGCQNIFLTRDKEKISLAIRKFVERECPELPQKGKDRFEEMAAFIEQIDESEYPYFVHKNSSCDDSVENWFSQYIEEDDDYNDEGRALDYSFFNAYIIIINEDNIEYADAKKYLEEKEKE